MIQLLQVLPLLQVDELSNATTSLSKASVELAEATANFGALKVVFGIFLVLVLMMMLGFFYQTFTVAKKVNQIQSTTSSCAAKMMEQMSETNNRSVGSAQAGILIRRMFNSLAANVKYIILRTRIESQATRENTEFTQTRIARQITNEYTELDSFLANFECDGRSLSEYINPQDAQAIIDLIMEQVQIDPADFNVSHMDQSVGIIVNGLKLDALKHI